MKQYHDLLKQILADGQDGDDRTGTGTRSIFGTRMEFDLKAGFPLVTTKFTPFRLIAEELLWFLSGSTNNNDLKARNVSIWDEWAAENGELGPIYGAQMRSWLGHRQVGEAFRDEIDQIAAVIKSLRERPKSRRHIVSAWNVADLPNEDMSPQDNVREGRMALAPCHMQFQFYARELDLKEREGWFAKSIVDGGAYVAHSIDVDFRHAVMDDLEVPRYALSCQMYQRSVDAFLGLPFNIASYALLTHMIAQQVGMIPDRLIWVGGDTHIYLNHMDQVRELLTRNVNRHALPKLTVKMARSIDDYSIDHFELSGYKSHSAIKAPISI